MNDTTPPNPTEMEDFVFGRLEADETTLQRQRQRWSGLRHRHDIHPLDPKPGQPVRLRASAGRDLLVDRVTAYVTGDGSDPQGSRGRASVGQAIPLRRSDTLWQPLYWDYADLWEGELPGQPAGAHVRYRIEGWHSEDAAISHWSREMNIDETVEHPTLYGYHVDRFRAPAWAHEAIVYQIFVDRFAPGRSGWLAPEAMNQFVGGNLQGISDRLDYIADLGVTALWLTPIFTCGSYHGYDTIDYYEIDPRFGTKEDLRALVAGAHARGLRIILDFVANHCSNQAPFFQQALHDPASPYRAWFSFGPAYKQGYRCFFDHAKMPQFDHDSPGARAYLLDAARYWLREFAVDGYRLDYAAGPSHDFWSAFGAACKEANPGCWLFGEVTMGSEWLRTYSGRLDGCLDFSFTRLIRRLVRSDDPAAAPISHFAAALTRAQRYFPPGFTRPTFIDNHDMNRFLWMAGNDKTRLRLAAGLLLTCGSSPILYYGTEAGLSQPRAKGPWREESRHPMPWAEGQDAGLLADFKRLIAARRGHPALVYGPFHTHYVNDEQGLWLVERRHEGDRALVAVNNGPLAAALPLPPGRYAGLDEESHEGRIELAARSLSLLVPA